jgi:LPXTG-motif cell wall-anchored protein
MLFMVQAVPGLSYHVSAASLTNGAMISVLDKDGKSVIPLTAVELKKNETAYDVLKEVTSQHHMKLDATYYQKYNGYLVNQIGEASPNGQDYWSFFINGSDSQVGLSSYKVKTGDDLLIKIVSYPEKKNSVIVSAKDKKGSEVIPSTKLSIVEGANAYDALKQATDLNKKTLTAPIDSNYFAFVQNIGDIKLDKNDYWNMSLNGKSMEVGLSSYTLKNGDHLDVNVTNPAGTSESSQNNTNGSTDNGTNGKGTVPAAGFSNKEVSTLIKSSAQYLEKQGTEDEFAVMALTKAGAKIPSSYLQSVLKTLKENNGSFRNVTDYERMAIGITAAGKNAANFNGYNLIRKVYSNNRMTTQGINGVVFALLAYDSGNYKLPENAEWSRQKLVQYLISHQLKDGGWALFGSSPSTDITAMALSSLAPYKSQGNVKNTIQKAVHWLSVTQDKQGGYNSSDNGGDSSETTAQVIIGLASVQVSPGSKEFTKPGGNLLKHLAAFNQKDGGYSHLLSDKASDQISTTQALLALTAYQSYLTGKGSVYQFHPSSATSANEAAGNAVSHSASRQGGKLPNTAANDENWLFAGIILIMAATIIYVIVRRRESMK